MTLKGFGPSVRRLIKLRAGTTIHLVRCERCGVYSDLVEIHHRRPRGSGGSKRPDTNQPANGLACCKPCHHYIEMNRNEAREKGWLISNLRNITPAEIPAHLWDGCYLLADDGERYPVPCRHEEAA